MVQLPCANAAESLRHRRCLARARHKLKRASMEIGPPIDARAHDVSDFTQVRDIQRRIGADEEEIGVLPLFDRSKFVVEPVARSPSRSTPRSPASASFRTIASLPFRRRSRDREA